MTLARCRMNRLKWAPGQGLGLQNRRKEKVRIILHPRLASASWRLRRAGGVCRSAYRSRGKR